MFQISRKFLKSISIDEKVKNKTRDVYWFFNFHSQRLTQTIYRRRGQVKSGNRLHDVSVRTPASDRLKLMEIIFFTLIKKRIMIN